MASYKGKTPALGDAQARPILDFPAGGSVKDKLDGAILSTRLYHALRRGELCKLAVKRQQSAAARSVAPQGFGQGGQDPLCAPTSVANGSESGLTPDGGHKLIREYSTTLGFPVGCIVCDRRPRPTR